MKAFRVRISAAAADDLLSIWARLADYSPDAADRILGRLNLRIDRLADLPERGAPRPNIAHNARMLVEGKYLILYRVIEGEVEVVRVVHGATNLSDITL